MPDVLTAPLPLFVAQAILILVVARLLGAGARGLGQPLVIAEIVAGIVLGPSLLGWLAPDVERALFPAGSLGLLGIAGQVGLMLFMFLVGLELDPALLRGRGRTTVAVSHASIAVPFALGGALAYWRADLAPAGVRLLPFLLFIGVAMSITAFPVLARILVERRLLKSKIGSVAIACAAVGDVTAWCVLAFVVSVARSRGALDALRTTGMAVAYIAAMVWIVRPVLAGFLDRTRLGLSQNLVAGTMVLMLLSSLVTEAIGLHALFGAFLFGAVLPKKDFAGALADKVEDLVAVLLLPLFFAYSGLRTEIGLLHTADDWITCGVVIAVACAGKFGGAAVAARVTGLGWRESSAIGVLMNTRGLMELIVLNIGLDLGVLTPKLFAMMVLMALVTTFITSPLLARIYPAEEMLRELARAGDEAEPALAPARYTALVCVSFERSGPGLVTLAAAIAGTDAAKSRVYALRLVRPGERASFVLAESADARPADTTEAFAPLMARARALSVKVRALSFVSSAPGRDICDVADVKHADIVLLGWHKPVFGATMLSGTVHEVMESVRSDVGVFIDRGLDRVKRILVPYLGSQQDRAALAIARRIAENNGANVTVLHVVPPERGGDKLGAEDRVREEFHETGGARAYAVAFSVVPHADPARAVIEESARGYDLMLVGLDRAWGLAHRSFGIQAEAILKESRASVLVVGKGEGRAALGALRAAPPRASFATMPDGQKASGRT